jgi:hypothetical protein
MTQKVIFEVSLYAGFSIILSRVALLLFIITGSLLNDATQQAFCRRKMIRSVGVL